MAHPWWLSPTHASSENEDAPLHEPPPYREGSAGSRTTMSVSQSPDRIEDAYRRLADGSRTASVSRWGDVISGLKDYRPASAGPDAAQRRYAPPSTGLDSPTGSPNRAEPASPSQCFGPVSTGAPPPPHPPIPTPTPPTSSPALPPQQAVGNRPLYPPRPPPPTAVSGRASQPPPTPPSHPVEAPSPALDGTPNVASSSVSMASPSHQRAVAAEERAQQLEREVEELRRQLLKRRAADERDTRPPPPGTLCQQTEALPLRTRQPSYCAEYEAERDRYSESYLHTHARGPPPPPQHEERDAYNSHVPPPFPVYRAPVARPIESMNMLNSAHRSYSTPGLPNESHWNRARHPARGPEPENDDYYTEAYPAPSQPLRRRFSSNGPAVRPDLARTRSGSVPHRRPSVVSARSRAAAGDSDAADDFELADDLARQRAQRRAKLQNRWVKEKNFNFGRHLVDKGNIENHYSAVWADSLRNLPPPFERPQWNCHLKRDIGWMPVNEHDKASSTRSSSVPKKPLRSRQTYDETDVTYEDERYTTNPKDFNLKSFHPPGYF
ncbi:hypothetical protein DIPPA_14738 [Diplonema papillatum]|nr:hypothetical protein DIPPA_14738 [Diplonema papillatum]